MKDSHVLVDTTLSPLQRNKRNGARSNDELDRETMTPTFTAAEAAAAKVYSKKGEKDDGDQS